MQVLLAIELIIGVFFVIVFNLAQIARDLARLPYPASPDNDDDDETRET
jgi:hypothetical protein